MSFWHPGSKLPENLISSLKISSLQILATFATALPIYHNYGGEKDLSVSAEFLLEIQV